MKHVATIGDEAVTVEDFFLALKLNGTFDEIMETLVKDRIAVQEAMKRGIRVSDDMVQREADDFRRAYGLHRAGDTHAYLESVGISVEQWEVHIRERLLRKTLMDQVASDAAVEEYFRLNSPRFETVELRHILTDSEEKAKEILAVLEDDPARFEELAGEMSLDEDSRDFGGAIGCVRRGVLPEDVEARVFSAAAGDLLGPFELRDADQWEVIRVDEKSPPDLDEETRGEIGQMLREEWQGARRAEYTVETC